jgi:hypothetical protein
MKTRTLGCLISLLFLVLASSPSSSKSSYAKGVISVSNLNPSPQETPVKKPKYDYMSTFLSRNTSPLGLKEDIFLKQLLKQPRINWAIRASARHILD